MSEPSDKSKAKNQSLSGFVVERLGFAFLGGVAGLMYAGVVCVTLYLLKIEISTQPFLHSFIVIFGCVGAILGQKVTPIIMSTIYGLMYLWGVLHGFIGYGSSHFITEDHFPKKSEYLWCVLLGFFAVVVFMFIK